MNKQEGSKDVGDAKPWKIKQVYNIRNVVKQNYKDLVEAEIPGKSNEKGYIAIPKGGDDCYDFGWQTVNDSQWFEQSTEIKDNRSLSSKDQGLVSRVEGSSNRGTIPLALVQISSRESLLKTS